MLRKNVMRAAICDFVTANPGCVTSQFVDGDLGTHPETDAPRTEADAAKPENWNYQGYDDVYKGYAFDCDPFDDQLRAYVSVDGEKVTKVVVQGE